MAEPTVVRDVLPATLMIIHDPDFEKLQYGKEVKRGTEHDSIKLTAHNEPTSKVEMLLEQMKAEEATKEKLRKVKGVEILCKGAITLNKKQKKGMKRFWDVELAKDHAIWDSEPIGASKIMVLPLLVHKQPHDPNWKQTDETRFDNRAATYLNLIVDPKNDAWGSAPPEWQSQVGSILLVRKDGKDLSREHAWALAEFMQRLPDSFKEAKDSGDERRRRAAISKMLNWKQFNNFLAKFQTERTKADGLSWAHVRSPCGTKEYASVGQDQFCHAFPGL